MDTEASPASTQAGGAARSPASAAKHQMKRHRRRKAPTSTTRPSEHLNLKPGGIQLKYISTPPHSFEATLTISNPSEHQIMFKVRTTHPKRYLVKPRRGVIYVNSVVNVRILVSEAEAEVLYKALRSGKTMPENKFRVESVVVPTDVLERLTKASGQEQAEISTTFWKDAQATGAIACDTLPVVMPSLQATNVESAPSRDNEQPAFAPAPAPVVPPVPATTTATAQPSAANPLGGPARVVKFPPASASTSAAPETNNNAPAPLTPEAMEELRAHYNDLLRFIVTESARHDQELTQRTMELEAANKRIEDAQARIKELEDASGGLRRRNVGGASESKSEDNTAGGESSEVKIVKVGFPLWQVVLLAVIMFVLGTLWVSSS